MMPVRLRLLLPSLFALLLAANAPARADVDAGVAAFDRGDYAKAIDEWRLDAAQGNANALFNLGQAYRLGKGVPVDLDQAESYYQRAARAGHPAAMGNLATLYYFSKKPPMVTEALQWWDAGARAGDPRSQYILGAMTFNGDKVKRDPKRAYAWTWLAAQAGLEEAKAALGTMRPYVPEAERKEAEASATSLMTSTGYDYWKERLPVEETAAEETPAPAPADKATIVADEKTPPAPAPAREEPAAAPSTPSLPKTPSASAAQPAPTAGGTYRVNLASLGDYSKAEDLWQRYVGEHAALFDGVAHRIDVTDRNGTTLYRLQAGAFATAAEAATACNAYKAAGLACFVLKTQD